MRRRGRTTPTGAHGRAWEALRLPPEAAATVPDRLPVVEAGITGDLLRRLRAAAATLGVGLPRLVGDALERGLGAIEADIARRPDRTD